MKPQGITYMKISTKKIETVTFPVAVTRTDIHEGECLLANKCMVRVAVERKLRELEPNEPNHHTRVDAGHIRFNLRGHRYVGDTPRLAKARLIDFDKEAQARRKARRGRAPFVSTIEAFGFKLVAVKGSKIIKNKAKRTKQINDARRKRIEAGQKQKTYTLHKRVVGFA